MEFQKIGRYEIKSTLGRGGMATVFRAYDPRFERDVAIKVLPQALLHDPQFRVRFDQEAKTIALLEHPAIVPVYDFGEEDGQPYIVMRMMTGGTLSDVLEKDHLTQEQATTTISRLAQALDAAHKQGIIHRDLKPGNILFDQYGNAYLSDFGIARITDSSANLTGSAIIGTPVYMSPEQIQGDREVDGRSDIYSLGIILFQMLTNQTPYNADTPAKVMMMHILEPVPDINAVDPGLPPGWGTVISKAMAKEPADRYQTAREMADHIASAIQTIQLAQSPVKELEKTTIVDPPSEVASAATSISVAAKLDGTEVIPPQPQTPMAGTQVVPPGTQVVQDTQPPIVPQAGAPPFRLSLSLVQILIFGLIVIVGGAFVFTGRQGNGPLAFLAAATAPPTTAPTSTLPPPTLEPTGEGPVIVVPTATEGPTEPPPRTAPPPEAPSPEPSATASGMMIGGADKLAFLHENDIWLANLDGTELKQLTFDASEKTNLHWTPDGQAVAYVVGKCAKLVEWATAEEANIACFETAEYLEGFEISPDGQQVAISLNRELFIVPFDLDKLRAARTRTDLVQMGTCEVLIPYTNNAVKSVHWSEDGERLAFVFLAAVGGLQNDIIRLTDITSCTFDPPRLDEFPGTRFTVKGYANAPIIQNFGWDSRLLFALNGFIRNGGYGDMYIYNGDTYKGELVNPIGGTCCYRDISWSPDGRYLTFAYQDIGLGADSVSEIYVIPFGTLGTGIDYSPIPLPPEFLTNPREAPHPILRPVQ
jgi:serine/threonine-protein kinase